ncbi:response regulator [Cellulomonas xiejunii]|uniref:response regulator n=1 Tax=Cellulomonas xiejunii TaxID=2968083 RepID=UPI001D0F1911|nr:response regulator transcription factor [Cellulomonas xiejunii]MCC2316062.1 response regulator transcription factor [Cellulomonas xiejunii]
MTRRREPIRVAVVDDQRLLVSAFSVLVGTASDMVVVGTALDGAAAVELCRSCTVDVVLMDIKMPVLDGVEATRRVRALPDPPAVLVLTTFDRDDYVMAALRAGAAGFLLKDAGTGEFLDGIRRVHAGQTVLAPEATSHVVAAALRTEERAATATATTAPTDPREAAPRTLVARALSTTTPREREVLALVGAGLTNQEISRRLYVAETTVKTHVSSLLGKLQCRDRIALAVLAHRSGVATEPPA